MDSESRDQQETEAQDDAARRQAALRALAQSQTQQPTTGGAQTATTKPQQRAKARVAATVSGRQQRARRRWGAIVSVVMAVIVIVAGAALGVRFISGLRATTPTPPPVMRLNDKENRLSCISNIAWSPDGKRFAAQGNVGDCGFSQSDSETGAVYIYDSASGKLIAQLHPDSLVFNSPAVERFLAANSTPSSGPASVYYQQLAWTPDGQALLTGFNVSPSDGNQSGDVPGMIGLLRLGVSQASLTSVWPDNPASYRGGNTIERWDLTTGKSSFVPMPPAAAMYHWNTDGTLATDGSSANKPIGAPNHGQTFTIWQSGSLQLADFQQGPNTQPVASPQDIQWAANIEPVSPDGRYYYSYFPAFGSLVPPSTKQGFAHEVTIEPHDKALEALARKLSATAAAPNPNRQDPRILVTWRPDGRMLAEVSANANGPDAAAAFEVAIYDTQTGKLVKHLTPNFHGMETGPAGMEMLMWSPDGSHLLLADNIYGAITIWGPGALPQG